MEIIDISRAEPPKLVRISIEPKAGGRVMYLKGVTVEEVYEIIIDELKSTKINATITVIDHSPLKKVADTISSRFQICNYKGGKLTEGSKYKTVYCMDDDELWDAIKQSIKNKMLCG